MMFSVYCLQWSASGLVRNVWRCQIGPKVVNGRRTDDTIANEKDHYDIQWSTNNTMKTEYTYQ